MAKSPLRLLSIVNRMDLWKQNQDTGQPLDAGEGRFVFCLTNGYQSAENEDGYLRNSESSSLGFTIIFEYGLDASSDNQLKKWVDCWHGLARTISRLDPKINENYLNESRFSENFVRGKFKIKNWGKIKIVQELKSRNISDINIKAIADKSEFKHGLFSPGTNIPIISPQEALNYKPDIIILLAWNFKNEIIKDLKEIYNWSGKVIVPFPYEAVIIEI